jgi:hypothetical protein
LRDAQRKIEAWRRHQDGFSFRGKDVAER